MALEFQTINQGSAAEFRQDININFSRIKTEVDGDGTSGSGINAKVEAANTTAASALENANTAIGNSNTAISTANTASEKSDTAISTANDAKDIAEDASEVAEAASNNADTAITTANEAKSQSQTAIAQSALAESNSTQALAAKGRIKKFAWPDNTGWNGSGTGAAPYTHVITILNLDGTAYTIEADMKIDILPDPFQIAKLQDKGTTSCVISNDNGTVTLYLLGDKTVASDMDTDHTDCQVMVSRVS